MDPEAYRVASEQLDKIEIAAHSLADQKRQAERAYPLWFTVGFALGICLAAWVLV